MRHCANKSLFQRQTRLGAAERLDLAFFIGGEDDRTLPRIDIKPDDVRSLATNCGSLDIVNCRTRAAEDRARAKCAGRG